jgi:hypothetical protein
MNPNVSWPAASTVGQILSRAGLTNPKRKKRRATPSSQPFSMVTAPNQLWCMDFKGYFLTGVGYRCDQFTITDAHSRFLIRCQAVARMDLAQVAVVNGAVAIDAAAPLPESFSAPVESRWMPQQYAFVDRYWVDRVDQLACQSFLAARTIQGSVIEQVAAGEEADRLADKHVKGEMLIPQNE